MRIWPEKTPQLEFDDLGAAGHTGNMNDRQHSYLRAAGFTGSLSDMVKEWTDNPVVPLNLDYGYLAKNASQAAGKQTNYTFSESNGDVTIDATNGTITSGATDDYIIFGGAFNQGGVGSGITYQTFPYIDGVNTGWDGSTYATMLHGNTCAFQNPRTINDTSYIELYNSADSSDISTFLGMLKCPPGLVRLRASASTGNTANNYITVNWSEWDPDGVFNTSTGTFTAPNDGYYLVSFGSHPAASNQTVDSGAELRLNGTAVTGVSDLQRGGSIHRRVLSGGMILLNLSSGDELRLYSIGTDQNWIRFTVTEFPESACLVSAYKTGPYAQSAGAVTSSTERFDNGGNFNASTGVFTVPEDGHYFFTTHGNSQDTSGVESQSYIQTPTFVCYGREYGQFTHRASTSSSLIQELTKGQTVTFGGVGANMYAINFAAIKVA